jgi:hypothetical protein
MSITNSESLFVALGTQRDIRLRHLSSVASSTLLYFSTLAHKRYDFRKKKDTERQTCVVFLYTFYQKHFSF